MTPTLDFSLEQARNYLQNVLFIDDKIYQTAPAGTVVEDVSDQEIDDAGKSLEQMRAEADPDNGVDIDSSPVATVDILDPPFDARGIVDGFAKQGILCGLFQPEGNGSLDAAVNTDLVRLCERADVVILDWDLANDGGDRVKRFLTELVKSSLESEPHHSRLCVVFTNQPSLLAVMQKLTRSFEKELVDHDFDANSLRIEAGATRVSIFGKPDVPGRTDEEKDGFEVTESKLAERVVEEFASLHGGLLPALTLAGLSAIRRNSKRFLDRFRSDLDAPFLLHRALTLHNDDSFEQFGELLADEVSAVLEDCLPSAEQLVEAADARTGDLQLFPLTKSWKTRKGLDYDAQPLIHNFLKNGAVALSEAAAECEQVKEAKKKGVGALTPRLLKEMGEMLTGSVVACESLAGVFCERTQYSSELRRLRFGAVIRHRQVGSDGRWTYSVCLMPICDCQRLTCGEQFTFPFWRMSEDALTGKQEKRAGATVADPDGNFVSLAAGGKLRDKLWLQEFAATEEKWVTAEEVDGRFFFADPSGKLEIEWVAELKTLHAQRIAENFGNKASRVGLVESEWLRLLCDR